MQRIDIHPVAPEEFSVEVEKDGTRTTHLVRLTDEWLVQFGAGDTAEALLYETFRFLLEHEEHKDIARAFELPVVAGMFEDYKSEMVRRLGGSAEAHPPMSR